MKVHYTSMRHFFFIFSIILISISSFTSYAASYSWNGSVSTAWNDTSNWTPHGIPTNGDNVTIGSTTRQPLLNQSRTINTFTITTDTLDLNSYTLTIASTATFTSGRINNGSVTVASSATTTFSGTKFGASVNITSNDIYLNGSVFNSTLTVIKKGTANNNGTGGNIFNAPVTLIDSGTGSLTLANNSASPDTFNSTLEAKVRNSGSIYLAHQATNNVFNGKVYMYSSAAGKINSIYYGTAKYNDTIFVSSTSSGGESFGFGTGSCTLAAGKTILVGSEGFSHTASSGTFGSLNLHNFVQNDATPISLTFGGTAATIYFKSGTVIKGNLNVSSPYLYLDGARFEGTDTLTATGSTSQSLGGNYFAGTVLITYNTSSSGTWTLGGTSVDTFATTVVFKNINNAMSVNRGLFLGNVTFLNTNGISQADRMLISNTGTCTFKSGITLDNTYSGVNFGGNGGITMLDTNSTFHIASGFTGYLNLKNVNQISTDTFNVDFTGNSNILYLKTGNTFNGPFMFKGQRILLNGSTFNNTVNILRTSPYDDYCDGGNVFNGTTIIKDSVSGHINNFRLATVSPDTFNTDVTFGQYGTTGYTSTVLICPAYTKNTVFKGNITVDGTSAIAFGTNGGKVIFSGNVNDTVKKSASYVPTFQIIEVNKLGGNVRFNFPYSINDTLFLTKGVLFSDTINILNIPDNKIISGGNDSSYIYGAMKKTGNDAFTFPLGDVALYPGAYHPIRISAPSNTSDVFTAQYFHSQILGIATDSAIENASTCEVWKLTHNTGSSGVTPTLGWNSNSCNVNTLADMRVGIWNGSKWKNKGNSATTGNTTIGTVAATDTVIGSCILTLADRACSTFSDAITQKNVTCIGRRDGEAKIFASGGTSPYTYLWLSDSAITTEINSLNPDTFFVKVTDAHGCVLNDTAVIAEPDSLLLSVVTTPSQCHHANGTAIASATGGVGNYYFFWTSNGEVQDTLLNLSAGIYEVTVTDSNGCSVKDEAAVSDSTGPVETPVVTNVPCHGSDGGRIVFSEGPDIALPCSIVNQGLVAAGTYRILLTDSNGCSSVIPVTVTEPPLLALDVIVSPSACGESLGTASALASGGTGALQYRWSSLDSDSIATNLPSGYDTLTVTDANGCNTQFIAAISDSDFVAPPLSVVQNVSCNGGNDGSIAVDLAGRGGETFYYSWANGDSSSSISDLNSGTYKVMISDASGCKQVVSTTILQPDPLSVAIIQTAPTTDSTFDGSATAIVSGGTPPYTYLWSPGSQTTASVSGLSNGTYTFTVTDSNGCNNSAKIRLVNIRKWSDCPFPPNFICNSDIGVCTDHGCDSLDITAFGADPTGTVSSECAFEAANYYINNFVRGHNFPDGFKLTFSSGTYIVGRQTYDPHNPDSFYALGHTIFDLKDCGSARCPIIFEGIPDNITGELPIIKYEDCLKYGAFDNPSGDVYLPCGYVDCFNIAFPGDLFNFSNCQFISIKNLELDGNIENMQIGGATDPFAGINFGHSAISMAHSSDIEIRNVNEHSFGYVGLEVNPNYNKSIINLRLINSKFNNNGCCGFAWESGSGVYASNCQFNRNAVNPITTMEASGIDIESQGFPGGPAASHGQFSYCQFMLNHRCGVENTDPTTPNLPPGYYDAETDFSFDHCTFVGSESGHATLKDGNPICIVAKRIHFNCCDFYGPINYVYDASITVAHPTNSDETQFNNCSFNEEYEVDGTIYSFTPDCVSPPDSSGFNTCDDNSIAIGNHEPLVWFGNNSDGYGRVLFNGCNFNTNYYDQLCRLSGKPRPIGLPPVIPAYVNCMEIRNCRFFNGGLNGKGSSFPVGCGSGLANVVLFQFRWVNFTGYNKIEYNLYQIGAQLYTRNDYAAPRDYWWGLPDGCFRNNIQIPSPVGCCSAIGSSYTKAFDSRITHNVKTGSVYSFSPCHSKYMNPPSNVLRSCPYQIIHDSSRSCDSQWSTSSNRMAANNSQNKILDNKTITVNPVPAFDLVNVGNLTIGDEVRLYDMLGNTLLIEKTNDNSLQLSLKTISPGIYIISATNSGPVKIIVTHESN